MIQIHDNIRGLDGILELIYIKLKCALNVSFMIIYTPYP